MNRFLHFQVSLAMAFIISLLTASHILRAQTFETAGSYISYISQQNREITKDFLSYTSAVAHGKSARKVEAKRQAQIQSTKDAIKKISAMPPYKGDKSLRDSCVSFLKIANYILNDDYGKIVNLEEVAEQSYDAMEAYLLAQDLASEKLKQASERLQSTEKVFASKNNVNLIESKDEVSVKMEQANKVNKYHRSVYLVFFKSYKQEAYMVDAMSKKNINGIEQNKNTLEKFSSEGIAKLGSIQAFNGDNSYLTACKQLLEFYQTECKDKMPGIIAYYLKEENYQKTKKAFESKREADRTKADVDQYNKAVNEFNQAVNDYNNTNNQLNAARGKLIENYNKVSQAFLDKHTPKYK
jgi:hypothetical protein